MSPISVTITLAGENCCKSKSLAMASILSKVLNLVLFSIVIFLVWENELGKLKSSSDFDEPVL